MPPVAIVTSPVPLLTATMPPASDSDTWAKLISVVVPFRTKATSPRRLWPAIETTTPVAATSV